MAKNLDELDRIRPVDPAALAAVTEELSRQERAWQLRELRAQTKLTQAQLAQRLHVGQNRVSQIESGGAERVRLDTLRQYAHALGGTLKVEIDVDGTSYPLVDA